MTLTDKQALQRYMMLGHEALLWKVEGVSDNADMWATADESSEYIATSAMPTSCAS